MGTMPTVGQNVKTYDSEHGESRSAQVTEVHDLDTVSLAVYEGGGILYGVTQAKRVTSPAEKQESNRWW